MKNFETIPIEQEQESNFGGLAQEKKKGLVADFLEEHPHMSRKARMAIFLFMGITVAFTAERGSAQEQDSDSKMNEMRGYVQSLWENPELFSDDIILELPKDVTETFSFDYVEETLNEDSITFERNRNGSLEDVGEGIFITTETRSHVVGKNEDAYVRHRVSTIIGKTENLLEPMGDLLEVWATGKTREAAIGSALQIAAENISVKVSGKTASEQKEAQSEASSESESLFVESLELASSVYIIKYRVIKEEYDEDGGYYLITLEVEPGESVSN